MLYQAWQVLSRAGETQMSALIISLAVIVFALACAHYFPKAPAPLIGVLAAAAIAGIFQLHHREVGDLPLVIPPFAGFSWKPSDVATVLPGALGLAFVSAVNLSVGIPARSLASVRCGATTRMSNLLHAVFILAFIVLGRRYISHLPVPALAGVTAYIGICLLEWGTWRRLPKMNRVDALGFLTTASATLVVNAVLAVALGCSFYLFRYLYREWMHPSGRRESTEKVAIGVR